MTKKIEIGVFLALLLCTLAVFQLNRVADTTISSPAALAFDLEAPPAFPQDWSIQNRLPFKYRLLFRWIVQGTWSVLSPNGDAVSFYQVFVAWSFVFFFGTLVAFYYFLRLLDLSQAMAFLGCLLFLVSPPVLLAYKYPVHTREDPLAYLFVVLTLIAIFRNRPLQISLLSTLAALTRETSLVVLPVYWIASREPLRKRVLVCVPPLIAAITVRLVLGSQSYDPFEGLFYNLETPWQSLAFLFVAFGLLWLPYLVSLRARWREQVFPSDAWRVLVQTGPVVLVLVLASGLVLARVREIRIPFLLFPWVIPLSLDWLRANFRLIAAAVRNPLSSLGSAGAFFVIAVMIILARRRLPFAMAYLIDFQNEYWLAVAGIHLAASLAFVAFQFYGAEHRHVRLTS